MAKKKTKAPKKAKATGRPRKIGAFSEYLDLVTDLNHDWEAQHPKNVTVWYRGHTSHDYDLLPNIFRKKSYHGWENELCIEFMIHHQSFHDSRIDDPWTLYTAMQHYGTKTRLLDWTRSPLMALFFALFDRARAEEVAPVRNPGVDAAVWMMDVVQLNNITNGEEYIYSTGTEHTNPYLPARLQPVKTSVPLRPVGIEPALSNRRILAQQGTFTVHGRSDHPIETVFKGAPPPHRIAKIVVAASEKEKLLTELFAYGFTEEQVYQDLDSLCARINRQYLA